MQVLGLLFSIMMLSSYYFWLNVESSKQAQETAIVDSITSSVAIYSGYVSAYAQSNRAITGQVTQPTLGLPTWFKPAPGILNYVNGGTSYVYYTTPTAGMASSLYDKTLALTVGTVQAGKLYNPRGGDTGITVPAVIPNGSLVFIR